MQPGDLRRFKGPDVGSPLGSGSRVGSADDILWAAQNIKRIEESLMNFYVI